MNKPALKRFATEARRELLERVELQARKIGITSEGIEKATIESSDAIFINGRQLREKEKAQRNTLISRIRDIGFDRVMEEVAYTWFNRFTALRFMEVNDYLPTKVRVLSSTKPGSTEPDVMNEALTLDLDLDKEYVYELKLNNNDEELFKYLVIKHCNDLNRYMPFMFETIDDYTEILFPDGLLGTDSYVRQMTNIGVIPEDDWKEVEIIGWLYQYYISEENERVIRAKKRYKAEELPFATQLFTPEWIVRYMVQNALGRYWIESHPEHFDLIQGWEFYLENQNDEFDFDEELAPYINKELKIEEIKCFDPAMGSGHILVYMFDVLYEIYSKSGYMEREIPRLIIENNLYGLDIDDRSFQLASFSIVMKAMEYNKRFLRNIEREGLKMNLVAIQQTNKLTDEETVFLAGESSGENYEVIKGFLNQFKHAKAIGSLIKIKILDVKLLNARVKTIEQQSGNLFELEMEKRLLPLFKSLIKQAELMNQQYDVFITNPPYAGNRYLTSEVGNYLEENYSDVKTDLFSAFIEYSFDITKNNGQIGFMSPFVWMFISSFEKLRNNIVTNRTISSLIQLEYSGFDGATVPICSFTLRNYKSKIYGEYINLSDFKGAINQPIQTLKAVQDASVPYRYSVIQDNFIHIPGSPIAYWASKSIIEIFKNGEPLGEFAEVKRGMTTSDNKQFLRFWPEVSKDKVYKNARNAKDALQSNAKWFPYSKGGGYRKWYGFQEFLVNWEHAGRDVINFAKTINKSYTRTIVNINYYFMPSVGFPYITSGPFSMRWIPEGFIYDSGGPGVFADKNKRLFILGLMNSKPAEKLLKLLNPTINLQIADVVRLPLPNYEKLLGNEQFNSEVLKLIEIAKDDWDSFETSWDFSNHPLLKYKGNSRTIKESYLNWQDHTEKAYSYMKKSEEEINKNFIELYGLNNEMTAEVDDNNITIRKANLNRDIISFISYAIGCLFGRYSLDAEGLIFAGDKFDDRNYKNFQPDSDNIVPVLSNIHSEDDVIIRIAEFLQVAYDEADLEENLNFIADTIGRNKNETARETLRRYIINDFYKDHLQVYKKRPLYWLFTSGKEKAFNCLIYMHRYDKTTLSRIRTDYLHEVQTRMDAEKKDLLNIINGDSTTKEITSAKKELKYLDKKIDELKAYDEKLHHMADQQIEIDLDDGVTVNYAKFEGLVAKI